MTKPRFLITGATGATGGEAVSELLAKGHDVRVLAHREDDRSKRLQDRGAEVVLGDLLDFDSVRAALRGVQRAYFVYPIGTGMMQATAQFAQASREAGVEAIVNMSQISARGDSKSHAARQHWLSERVFDWSGVPVTHLRPTFFAEWLLYLAPMIRQQRLFVPFGTGRHAPIAAEDQGRVIAGILQSPEAHRGKTYPLFGPVEHTHAEIAAIVGRALGKEIEYKQVAFEVFAELLMSGRKESAARGAAASKSAKVSEINSPEGSYLLQHLQEVAIDHQNGIFSGTNDVVQEITGRPPMSVEEFVLKNKGAFV
jgi:NAD(P)H dehydrogenase (quinone)